MSRMPGGLLMLVLLAACTKTWTVPPGAGHPTVVGALMGSEHRIMADLVPYGFPGTEMLRYREGYVLSYDATARTPRWVAERLNAKRLADTVGHVKVPFRVDRTLPDGARSQSADFHDSGYVRGRMAAATNHRNDLVALEQTYYLSNCAPQDPRFRQDFWVELEERVRDWARASDDLYVVTGPLYLASGGEMRYPVIGSNAVGVPTHFFKVMLRERNGRRSMQAFLVPHDAALGGAPLEGFLTTVDEVERLSGLDFFPDLSEPTQARLEAERPEAVWPAGG